MHLLFRRYTRSGYAPKWFYFLGGVLFAGLAVWAAFEGEWLLAVAGGVMSMVAISGSQVMRRLSMAADESQRRVDAQQRAEEEVDG
jgi:hypothetical protein